MLESGKFFMSDDESFIKFSTPGGIISNGRFYDKIEDIKKRAAHICEETGKTIFVFQVICRAICKTKEKPIQWEEGENDKGI